MKNKHKIDKNIKVLSVKNLRKHFRVGVGKKALTIPAVDDISFDIYKGEVFGLVGESGCGKTTTGRTLIKLYSPTDGTIDFTQTEKNGKPETVRIGSGYSGNLHRIRKAKEAYELNVLEHKPFARKKHEIKQSFLEKEAVVKQEIAKLEQQLALETENHYSEYTSYKENLYNLKQTYILAVDDLDFEAYSEILKLTATDDTEVSLPQIAHQRKFLKENYLIKKSALKDSAGLSKEEIRKQQAELHEWYIEEDLKYSTVQEELKATIDKEQIKAEKQVIKAKAAEIKKQLKLDKKNLKEQYQNDYKKLVVDYHNSYATNAKDYSFVLKHKNNFRKHTLRFTNSDAMTEVKNQINEQKGLLRDLNKTRKQEVRALYKDRATNRSEYVNNNEEIAKLKEELALTIRAEKEGIRNSKRENSLKDNKDVMTNIQMIFQDPIESLNPRMTVREIVAEGLIVQGIKDKEYIDNKVIDILETVGLSREYLSRYPHEFSGGQRQRIGIARALILEPEFIIADEPVSALDVSIQAQVINLLNDLKHQLGLTILFIAHDLSVVKYFTDRIAVMNRGKIVELADSDELFSNPIHPYTKSLLSAIPEPNPKSERLKSRIFYDPMMHDYSVVKPVMHEVSKEHFIYGTDAEVKEWTKGVEK